MNEMSEYVLRSLVIGAGATAVMDGWSFLLRRFGIPSLNFAYLGRWIAYLLRGRWLHANIAQTPPVKAELTLGWLAHYAIGITLAAGLLGWCGLAWARSPDLGSAVTYGVVTVVAPLFILQPALGAGVASRKTPRPWFNSLKSVVTHTVFGIGLFAAARAITALVTVLSDA